MVGKVGFITIIKYVYTDIINSGRTDAEDKTAGAAIRADENGIVMLN
jgi:hypothetical protein